MKLLSTITYYSPYMSGLTLYAKRLTERLAATGIKNKILTMRYDRKLPVRELINGVEIVRSRPLWAVSKGFISLDFTFKSLTCCLWADVILVNLPEFEGVAAAFFGKIFGKKVIAVYHCEVILPDSFVNKLIQSFLNFSNWLTLYLSETIITYTDDFADHSKLLSSFRQKVKVIYPPVERLKVNKRVQKIIQDKVGRPKPVLIGIAARLAAEKGVEYALEAIPLIAEKLKNKHFKIIIAGPLSPIGEVNYKQKILNLARQYEASVVFLGEIKAEDMGSFYSLLDVLVLPSVNSTESFGMVQVEAMMMGVPVVASDLPGVRVPIKKTGMGIIVPVANSQKLAEAIVEVLVNKKEFIRRRELIEKEFSREKTIDLIERIIG